MMILEQFNINTNISTNRPQVQKFQTIAMSLLKKKSFNSNIKCFY